MTRRDSDPVGPAGASLTPPVPHVGPARDEQSSGFFDLGVLRAMVAEQERAQAEAAAAERARAAEHARVLQYARALEQARDRPLPARAAAAGARATATMARAVPHAGVGPVGVAVAWLATVTLGGLLATSAPSHARVGGSSAPVKVATALEPPKLPPAAQETSSVSQATAPAAGQATPAAPAQTAGADGLETAAHSPPPQAPPVAPRAPARVSTPSRPAHRPNPAHRTPPPATPPMTQAAAGTPVAPAAPVAPPPTRTTAAPAPSGASLDDLIRRAVAADQSKR